MPRIITGTLHTTPETRAEAGAITAHWPAMIGLARFGSGSHHHISGLIARVGNHHWYFSIVPNRDPVGRLII